MSGQAQVPSALPGVSAGLCFFGLFAPIRGGTAVPKSEAVASFPVPSGPMLFCTQGTAGLGLPQTLGPARKRVNGTAEARRASLRLVQGARTNLVRVTERADAAVKGVAR